MGFKNRIYRLSAVVLVAAIVPLTIFCISGYVAADSLRASEIFVQLEVSPTALPAREELKLIALAKDASPLPHTELSKAPGID